MHHSRRVHPDGSDGPTSGPVSPFAFEGGASSQFTPHIPDSPPLAHPASQSGPFFSQFHPIVSSFTGTTEGSPSSRPITHAPPHALRFSLQNSSLSTGPAMSAAPAPSEYVAHGTSYASENNAVISTSPYTPFHGWAYQPLHILPSTTVPLATNSGELSNPTNSNPEHVESWYRIRRVAIVMNGPRLFVPQNIYQPHAQGDMERYVSLAMLHRPIIFVEQGSVEWGVPLQRLLSKQFHLVDGNEPAFPSSGPSIGIRLQWPGYPSFHKQVQARDYTLRRNMITKAKLAMIVAKCVNQFMDAMIGQSMQAGSDGRWRVGPPGIQVDDIILVSLHHVSQGSWQPQLRLRRVIAGPDTATSSWTPTNWHPV